jgi:SpoVK/Ycf46/Vps4 family AAA+-type ATPase
MTDQLQLTLESGSAPTPGRGDEAAKRSTSEIDCAGKGIKSPRQIRTLCALLDGPISRERLDRVAGSSNSPDVVAALRRCGLRIICDLVEVTDRDGRKSYPGIYSLHTADRPKAIRFLDNSKGAK